MGKAQEQQKGTLYPVPSERLAGPRTLLGESRIAQQMMPRMTLLQGF